MIAKQTMRYVLEYLEYERGWGSKLDGVKYFPATDRGRREAIRLRDGFNATNIEKVVPDWYMSCQGPYLREVVITTDGAVKQVRS